MPILGLTVPGPAHPPHFSLERLIRPNILSLEPYRCARDDYSEGVLLDANENAMGSVLPKKLDPVAAQTLEHVQGDLNRYPSPTHDDLKRKIAKFRGVPDEHWVFLGVGSDEVIDLLFRVLCVPGKDKVMTTPPTYGMYGVTAQVNDVGVVPVPLTADFQLDEAKMSASLAEVKILFVCSPGNPTGTVIPLDAIKRVLDNPTFTGVLVVDEAYIDFAPSGSSAASLVNEYANVCVTQTLSKSFGLAAIRLGYLLAPPPLVQILTNAKAPYNISLPTASLALSAVSDEGLAEMQRVAATLNDNRDTLIRDLRTIPRIGRVLGGNHANFILVEVLNKAGEPDVQLAMEVYKTLADSRGVVVRFRGKEPGCKGCLRITVGTEKECKLVTERLRELLQ
ncbi:histidinol-phosphate transaminase [Kockovaella imperatae]|uniref:histidinol-phosphate transaminase n=1 Tax=Kockovaella imperatae TaxID=4999 RepID=A0A1Y1URU9_9TREE|nr:histidinol-phosphate transaminase [Kockovaella imperatae]ORX39885.1 histidinol-phosphate transaminase [Kockovaella imperatae]